MKKQTQWRSLKTWGLLTFSCLLGLLNPATTEAIDSTGNMLGGPTHIGTFEGSTTFTTSSSNGINPGLYLEVMDEYGNYTEYTSEEGVITLPDTKEGAYITQAKLLGKTKYVDQDTGELLDQWEDGRNLTLESVQMPVLTTTGKNLFDGELEIGAIVDGTNRSWTEYFRSKNFIPIKPNTVYGLPNQILIDNTLYNGKYELNFYDNDKKYIGKVVDKICTTPPNAKFMRFCYLVKQNFTVTLDMLNETQIYLYENGTTNDEFEPYKTNILTVNEPVELRGIGEVRDTLDCLTGEVTERIGEIMLDGSEGVWSKHSGLSTDECDVYWTSNGFIPSVGKKMLSDKLGYSNPTTPNTFRINDSGGIFIGVSKGVNINDYLSQNTPKIQYDLSQSIIKTVVLNSTYEFPPVTTREILVNGSIVPLICSVTAPTKPLSFVLNPNLDEGQRFIAPDFTIRNQTPSAVTVELKQFKQTTADLRDVLPSAHADWNTLGKTQSKDIALALVPKASDGWQSLIEGPRYVADPSNYFLGTIKAESSVDFTFEALHGRAFTEALSPQYRLVVVFGF